MKVSYEERLAIDFGLRRRCDSGNNVVLSVCTGGSIGQLLSSEILTFVCRPCPDMGKATPACSLIGENMLGAAELINLSMCGKSKTREPGGPINPKVKAHHWGPRHFGGQGTALRVSLS